MKKLQKGVCFLVVFVCSVVNAGADCPKAVKAGAERGRCAPTFSWQESDGNTVNLSDFRDQVVLVHFWATWCEPCREEIASLVKLHKNLQSKPFRIVSISLDDDLKVVKKFFGGKLPPFTVVLDQDRRITPLYGTSKVPESFVVRPGGVLDEKVIGSRFWEDGITQRYLELLTHAPQQPSNPLKPKTKTVVDTPAAAY